MDARRSRTWKGQWRSWEGEGGQTSQLFKRVKQEQQWVKQVKVTTKETKIFFLLLQQIFLKVKYQTNCKKRYFISILV